MTDGNCTFQVPDGGVSLDASDGGLSYEVISNSGYKPNSVGKVRRIVQHQKELTRIKVSEIFDYAAWPKQELESCRRR